MAQWRKDDRPNEIEIAAGVPDALAILDADGNLIGWDERAADCYLGANRATSPER